MSKREQTRERILSAAWHLFETQGYQETSTRQIARQAGVADGTVFSHFETKLAILREGMLSQLTRLSEQSRQGLDSTVNNQLELGMQFANTYYRYYFANVNLSRALLKEVIWDMNYYHSFNQDLFDATDLSTTIVKKMPLILDCYFMTLITHLSHDEPKLDAALNDLESKYRLLLSDD